ncbi:MAG TPA: hypothetical protein VF793_02275 [Telluria sp.]
MIAVVIPYWKVTRHILGVIDDVSPSIDTRKLGLGLTDIAISDPGG